MAAETLPAAAGSVVISEAADLDRLTPDPGGITVLLGVVKCPTDLVGEVGALVERFERVRPEMMVILNAYQDLAKRLDEFPVGLPDDFFEAFQSAIGWDRLEELTNFLYGVAL